jgi:hypothetical protein
MQHILLFIFFVVSPILLFAQDTDTKKRMQELGFVKVDLNELGKTQSTQKEACSSCALKQANAPKTKTKINHEKELGKLKSKLPFLEQKIQELQASNNTDPSVLQKHQTALKNTKDTIIFLEKELALVKLSSR